jgi:hypothetical protein
LAWATIVVTAISARQNARFIGFVIGRLGMRALFGACETYAGMAGSDAAGEDQHSATWW